MVDYQSIISGAGQGTVGIVAGLFGANKAAKERKKMERYLDRQDAENTSWYNANALSDYTQRADSQALIKNMRDNLTRENRRAENMSIVTGATPEQQAVQREQSNKVISDTYSKLGAMGQQWKDQITDRYLAIRSDIADKRMGVYDSKARNYETLFMNGVNTFADSFKTAAGNGGSMGIGKAGS